MFLSSRDRGQSRLSFKGVAMKLSWLFSLIVVLGACALFPCCQGLISRVMCQPTHASIADRDQQLIILGLLRLDRKFAFSVHILHGIDAIEHEVHEDLLQLDAISHDLGRTVASSVRTNML